MKVFFMLLLCLLTSACSTIESTTEQGSKTVVNEEAVSGKDARLIIQFTPMLSQQQAIEKLARFGLQYNTKFIFVRAMSGGAYVIIAKGMADETQLTKMLAVIAQRQDVLYIEQDKMLQHYSK
ncbi:MAG: hypothetical protein JKY87_02595 [Mariprofundus sp.]|nr:hypothetical protein [Mariprofundus sp.]